MKNIALLILTIATVAFASLYLHQTIRFTDAQVAVETLQQKVADLESTAAEQENKNVTLRAELNQAQTDGDAKDREIVQLRAGSANPNQRGTVAANSATPSAPKPANAFASLAKMFDDPEMRDAIATQQKVALGPTIDKMYGKLFSDLQLTPDQAAALKEMLLNKQLAGAQMGMSMLSEGGDRTKTTELTQKIKASNDAADAQIKAFLGEEKYGQLKAYEKTTGDRMAISGFKDQLSAGSALTAEQEQQLIDVMTQTRQDFKFTTDLSDKSKFTGDFSAMFNEENVNRFMQEMDQLNQRFVGHAQNILTPDQLESFQKHLNGQLALQKVGMQMGAKMFAQPR